MSELRDRVDLAGPLARKEAVELSTNDSPEDFASFYERSRDGCLRAVSVSVGNPTLAEDLTAEAFARALADWRKVSRHPAPEAWVVRVALNAHVSWWRKLRREVPWSGRDDDLQPGRRIGADVGPGLDSGSGDSDSPMLDAMVLSALRALPERQREVVTLRLLLDLDTDTTARVLGISPSAVKTHLSRAAAALRGRLAPPQDKELAQ